MNHGEDKMDSSGNVKATARRTRDATSTSSPLTHVLAAMFDGLPIKH